MAPPAVDLGVLARHAAEGDEQLAVLGEHAPSCVCMASSSSMRRHDMRHQHERRAEAVVIAVAHVAADRVEETLQLALGVMEASGARPAIGAAEDRPVAEIASSRAPSSPATRSSASSHAHLDERLGAAPLREGAGAVLEPALAHGGTAHAQPRHLVGQHVQADRRGIGILREGMQMDGLARRRRTRLRRRPNGPRSACVDASHGTIRPRGHPIAGA